MAARDRSRSLHDYSGVRRNLSSSSPRFGRQDRTCCRSDSIRHRSYHHHHHQDPHAPVLCASLTHWNMDPLLRPASHTSIRDMDRASEAVVTFRLSRPRMEQHQRQQQQQQQQQGTSDRGGQAHTTVRSAETDETELPSSPRRPPRRRASLGTVHVTTTRTTRPLPPEPLRRYASLTELEEKLKLLPGHSPPRNKPPRTAAAGASFDNEMTQHLQATILNANDVPQNNKRQLLRRCSLGGGSMHSSSMDSSVHSTSAYGGPDELDDSHPSHPGNTYGYGDMEVSKPQTAMEMDPSHALRRMRRSSIGGSGPSNYDSNPYGYGEAAPNIRILNPPTMTRDHGALPTQRRNHRRSSLSSATPSADAMPTNHTRTTIHSSQANYNDSPNVEAARAMRLLRRSSIGGVLSTSSHLRIDGADPSRTNPRWEWTQSDASPPSQTSSHGNAKYSGRGSSIHDNGDDNAYSSPVRSNSGSSSRISSNDKKSKRSRKKSEDPNESLRGLEQLAIDLSGQATQTSPKRTSPRRDAPPVRLLKIDLSDEASNHNPTDVVPTKRVVLNA